MTIIKENQQASDIVFVTFKIINDLPVFTDKNLFDMILENLTFYRKNKGWKIYAYTILINHLHLIIKILPNFNLDHTVGEFKSYTAKKILSLLRENNQWDILKEMEMAAMRTKKQDFKIWRRNIWPKAISTKKFLFQKAKYINLNAQKHGVVKNIEAYPYTSFHNHYCNHRVALEIDDIKELL